MRALGSICNTTTTSMLQKEIVFFLMMVQAFWDLTQPLFSTMMANTSDQISLVT